MSAPTDVGHWWYECDALGRVPVTVTRDPQSGRLIAQYLGSRWPVQADIYGGTWLGRAEPPKRLEQVE